MSRGLSPQNALEDHQNGGKTVASSVAEIIYRNSFIYFENGLIYVSKEIKGKELLDFSNFRQIIVKMFFVVCNTLVIQLRSLLFKPCLGHLLNNKDQSQGLEGWAGEKYCNCL